MSNPAEPEEKKPVAIHRAEDVDYREEANVTRIHEQIRREKVDPDLGDEPLPLWGIGFVMVILALGFTYFGMFSGGFRGDVYDERGGAAMAAAGGGAATEEEDPMVTMIKNGKRVFQANCQACHQATGGGVAGLYPPLVGTRWVLENDERLISLILGGLQGPIEVKGNTYNNVMVGWAPTLSDSQVASVITYIRQEWGNEAPPVTPEQVAAARSAHPRSEAWTAAELIETFGD